MQYFNGTMPIIDSRSATAVTIDACKTAAGGFFNGDFVYTPWTQTIAKLPINYLEVLSLEPAVQRWAPAWANKKVYIHCDNMTACAIINRGSCKHMLFVVFSGSQPYIISVFMLFIMPLTVQRFK